MDRLSISQLASYTGVKVVTIRAWENRYGALQPERSEGNTRYYSGDQLKRLLNIVSLVERNHKVSEICSLSDMDLKQRVAMEEAPSRDCPENFFITQLIAAGINYNEQHFSTIFSHCLLRYGIRDAYLKVIYPLILRIGMLWRCDAVGVAHEHFISHLLRQKLLAATDLLPAPEKGSKPWVLYLPENEFHELGLLTAHYLIRQSGYRSIYLGANIPLSALQGAAAALGPGKLLSFQVMNSGGVDYYQRLANLLPDMKIYVAGLTEVIPGIDGIGSLQRLEEVLFTDM
jgi:MerR family transcriptional regulator, light-induced transcriptional regulator